MKTKSTILIFIALSICEVSVAENLMNANNSDQDASYMFYNTYVNTGDEPSGNDMTIGTMDSNQPIAHFGNRDIKDGSENLKKLKGDFYFNEDGVLLYINKTGEGKYFIIKTSKKTPDIYHENYGAAKKNIGVSNCISKANALYTEEMISQGIIKGKHMANVVCFGAYLQMEQMLKIVSQDNGKGGADFCNNKEYGGIYGGNPKKYSCDTQRPIIEIPCGEIPSAKRNNVSIKGDPVFHTHPSGNSKEYGKYMQPPSKHDLLICSKKRDFELVFAMREKVLYVYNNKGTLATIPIKALSHEFTEPIKLKNNEFILSHIDSIEIDSDDFTSEVASKKADSSRYSTYNLHQNKLKTNKLYLAEKESDIYFNNSQVACKQSWSGRITNETFLGNGIPRSQHTITLPPPKAIKGEPDIMKQKGKTDSVLAFNMSTIKYWLNI